MMTPTQPQPSIATRNLQSAASTAACLLILLIQRSVSKSGFLIVRYACRGLTRVPGLFIHGRAHTYLQTWGPPYDPASKLFDMTYEWGSGEADAVATTNLARFVSVLASRVYLTVGPNVFRLSVARMSQRSIDVMHLSALQQKTTKQRSAGSQLSRTTKNAKTHTRHCSPSCTTKPYSCRSPARRILPS